MTSESPEQHSGVVDPFERVLRDLQEMIDTDARLAVPEIDPDKGIDFYQAVADYERALIVWALHATNGQQRRAAKLLGMQPSTLCTRIKDLKIRSDDAGDA